MRQARLGILAFIVVGWVNTIHAQQDVEELIDKPDAAIQAQIQKLYDTLQKSGVEPDSDMGVCHELQILKKLSPDQDKLVKQLAIFAATTTKRPEDMELLILQTILQVLDVPPRISIRALAPYLDAENPPLRESVRLWFRLHDTAGTDNGGTPPIKPVNYEDYLEYVQSMLAHKEDVPTPFLTYIFESSPGRAVLVFAYANSPNIHIVTRQQKLAAAVQAEKAKLREIELAEHIVSNAIWLNKNKFNERFQVVLPDAMAELEKLAKHKEWWARLYVVYIMRQNPPLLWDKILRQLSEDSNALVSQAAKSAGQ